MPIMRDIVLSSYAAQIEAGFSPNLADGMRRIAAVMVAAENESKRDYGESPVRANFPEGST